MPTNPLNGVEIPLSLFGGLDTELSPSDVPQGVSPDNQDVVYLPGSVASRPCLRRVFGSAISGTPALEYLKTYVQTNGDPLNLYLDATGALWKEDVNAAPGVISKILTVTPGAVGKSCSGFGREWLAFSNGTEGVDVPRQYNGATLDRVTQDGPGAPPTTVADYTTSATISSIAGNGSVISTITTVVDPGGATATLTATTSTAHGLVPSQVVQVEGNANFYANGQQVILTVPTTTTFTYSIALPSIQISALGRVSNVAEIASATGHNLRVGDTALVTGVQDGTFNGLQTVTVVVSTVQWEYANSGSNTSPAPGSNAIFIPQTLSSGSGGNVYSSATITFSALPANTNVGDPVQVLGSAAGGGSLPYDSNVGGNPTTWPILSISGATVTISITGIQGLTASNGSTTGGTATIGGLSSTGQYQVVQYFLTRNGALTAPSPPITFQSNGGAKFKLTGLAIGPSNVVARFFGFTGSGGSNFFTIPAAITLPNQSPGGNPIVIQPTVVLDNTSTSAIVNFSDNALFDATGIDIPGNNLFNQVTIGPCLGFFAFAERLFVWGEWSKIQNFQNMGFDGGYITANTPTGWTVATTGGALTSTGVDYGFGWQITGDGTSSAKGQITQSAYQDYLGVPIVAPATQYSFRVWIEASGTTGNLTVDLYSAGSGVLATGSVALSGVTSTGKFYQVTWSAATPAVMPSDAVIRVYATSQANAQTVTVDEVSILPTAAPFNLQARGSYVDNPEAFDGVSGNIGAAADPTQIMGFGRVRDSMVMATGRGPYVTIDSATGEPATWVLNTVSTTVGALSINSVDAGRDGTGDSGEEWILIAARAGLYIYEGGQIPKISQEIQQTWERINWAAQSTIWVKNDTIARRIYVGVPLDGATLPSHILVLDRRELETAQQIAQSPPMRISFTGKMIASDLCRKWTIWNLAMNCAEIMPLASGQTGIVLGCGKSFGQAYTLGPQFSTDDDYGQVSPYYVPFFFVNHELEQQFGLGSQRKLYKQITTSASGVGNLLVTPLADALTNAWPSPPAYPLPATAIADQALGLNVTCERMAPKISSQPLSGQTDNGFNLAKLVLVAVPCPVAQTAGSIV